MLFLESGGDFLAGDAAVETALRAALDLQGDDLAAQAVGQLLSGLAALALQTLLVGAFALDFLHCAGRGLHSPLAGKEIVAGKAVGYVENVVLLAGALDVAKQNHFHGY